MNSKSLLPDWWHQKFCSHLYNEQRWLLKLIFSILHLPTSYLGKTLNSTKRKGTLPFSELLTQLLFTNNTINFVFQSCTRHCFRAFKWYRATIQKWYWTNGIKSHCIYCQWRKKWKQKGRRPVPTPFGIIGFYTFGWIVQCHSIKVKILHADFLTKLFWGFYVILPC